MVKTLKGFENSKKRRFRKEKYRKLQFSNLPLVVRHQFEKLKSHIILGNLNGQPRSILFSSYNHGEGTTSAVANFAESLAQEQKYKILAVDANTRSPSLQVFLGANNPSFSLTFPDMIVQNDSIQLLKEMSNTSNLIVIQSKNTANHPSQVFDHTHFASFIENSKKFFDFIIFDSSPIGKYYDSIVIASHLDGVILVAEAEKTLSSELKRAKQMLVDKNIPILGVILNRRRFPIPRFIFKRFFL